MATLTSRGVIGEIADDSLEAQLSAIAAEQSARARDLPAEAEALRERIAQRDAAAEQRKTEASDALDSAVEAYHAARIRFENAAVEMREAREAEYALRRQYEVAWSVAFKLGVDVPVRIAPVGVGQGQV